MRSFHAPRDKRTSHFLPLSSHFTLQMGYTNLYCRAAARRRGREGRQANRTEQLLKMQPLLLTQQANPEEPKSARSNTLPSHPHLRGTQGSVATLVAFSSSACWTHLPPPVGAAEFIACTMSVVRASSKLVINSIFFPSGQPVERKEEV